MDSVKQVSENSGDSPVLLCGAWRVTGAATPDLVRGNPETSVRFKKILTATTGGFRTGMWENQKMLAVVIFDVGMVAPVFVDYL